MTETAPRRGRPKYSQEERFAASNESFLLTMVPHPEIRAGGQMCITTKSDHIVGYDGKRIRVRKFAWEYWNPTSPVGGGRVVRLCQTAGCVAQSHLQLLRAMEAAVCMNQIKPVSEMDPRREAYAIKNIKEGSEVIRIEALKGLKLLWQEFPVSLESNSDEVLRRHGWIAHLMTNGDEAAADEMVGPDWGVLTD